MATLKFYPQPANKKNLYPIMMCYQDKGKKFRFYTKVNVDKDNWQKNKFKPVTLKDFEDKNKFDTCETVIRDIEKEAISKNKQFSISEVELRFRANIKKTKPFYESQSKEKEGNNPIANSEFLNLFDQFVEQRKATKAPATIVQYNSFKNTLLKFEQLTGETISFESINSAFYQKFQNCLITKMKLKNNTIGSHIKNLKVFLNYAMQNELTEIKYNFKEFKTIIEDINIIALNSTELFSLYDCKKLTVEQEIARDYFCFECFTGLRYSDICKLKDENIKEEFIEMRTKKTKDILFIPINVFAKEILDKYKNKFEDAPLPPAFKNNTMNNLIKQVAKIAEINEPTMVEKYCGSSRTAKTKPKYVFVSTHTGRRTFITLSHERGMQIEMIMEITGIKEWDTLKRYLKVSEKNKLIKMNEYWNIKKIS